MEEREQPSCHLPNRASFPDTQQTTLENNPIPHQSSPQSQNIEPLGGAGTYIVQVPKDQVFRIPTPENGQRIHQNLSQQDGRSRLCCCCCSSCVCLCMLVIMIVVTAGMVGVVIFLTHDDPSFHIEHVMFKKPPPEFDIRVKVENPNKYKEISYDQRASKVSLSFKQKEIAEGKFPILDQDPNNTTILGIVLHGPNLPEAIVKCMNSTKSKIRIPLTLSMNIGVQFKVGGQNINSKRIEVSCSLLVDRLDKDTQILTQNCSTY